MAMIVLLDRWFSHWNEVDDDTLGKEFSLTDHVNNGSHPTNLNRPPREKV